jgi:glycine dehydrogenase subunit 1
LYQELIKTGKFEVGNHQTFFKEFVLKAKFDIHQFELSCLDDGILGPLHIGDNQLLFAVTERRTQQEIDHLVRKVVDAQ